MSKKGFTLIELLVVVAVLALLASIVFSNLGGAREGARISNALSFQSQTHSLLGSDLVGWWNFDDGDARDISGYGNHGTIVGATLDEGISGTGGNSLAFGGNGDHVDFGNDPIFNLPDELTLSVWIKADNFSGGIITKGQTGGWINNEYVLRTSGSTVRFYTSDGENSDTLTYDHSDVANGSWNYLVATTSIYKAEVKIYLNGSLYDEKSRVIGQVHSTSSNLRIGQGHNSSGGTWFNGLIDDVRIYSRALTAQEVQGLYAQTKDKYLANE